MFLKRIGDAYKKFSGSNGNPGFVLRKDFLFTYSFTIFLVIKPLFPITLII